MFPSVSAEVDCWLDESFISVEKFKSTYLSQKGKDDIAWKITRDSEDGEFKLDGAAPGEVLDTTATTPLKSLFSYARFEDVVPAANVAEKSNDPDKRKAVIETFEGFIYQLTLTPVKGADDKQLMTVSVSAELPKERKKEEGEKDEDAKTKDEAFKERMKTLTEKLAKEQKLAGRTFEVTKSSLDALLKERDQLITKATPPPAEDAAKGSVQKLPGGIVTTPPAKPASHTATTPPIEAVTPPIAIPPLDEEKKDEPEKKAE